MGFYSRHLFPRLCDWVMSDPGMTRLRGRGIDRGRGRVSAKSHVAGPDQGRHAFRMGLLSLRDPDAEDGVRAIRDERLPDS